MKNEMSWHDAAEKIQYYKRFLALTENELARLSRRYENLENVRLRVQHHRNGYQYFVVKRRAEKEETAAEKAKRRRGTYIRKRQQKTAQILAQRDYLVAVRKNCLQWLAYYDAITETPVPATLSELHLENPGRQHLIHPVVLSDREFLDAWRTQPYTGKSLKPDCPYYVTARGEKVRSKSEKMIADLLAARNIPYKYECPLKLRQPGKTETDSENGATVVLYPDFTLLNMKTREEIYLEHFGMLDKDEYERGTVWKLSVFAANGILAGRRLLFFWEGAEAPLNLAYLEQLLQVHGL